MTDDARKQALEALMYAHKMLTHMNVPTGLVTEAIAALSSAAPSAAEPVAVTDDMVTRFLGWKLPQDFAPDCGISFTPPRHPNGWPIGTNLLNATQARQMIAHVLAAPKAASEPVATQAARDVLAERQRQISTEGYTPEHDDEHGAEEFGRAASVYANPHVYDVIGASYMGWPWDEAWYKPTTQRRNFVKAAALLLAGIECIDRATLHSTGKPAQEAATCTYPSCHGDEPADGGCCKLPFTSNMAEAAEKYWRSVGPTAHPLPAQFRWSDVFAAMMSAAPADAPVAKYPLPEATLRVMFAATNPMKPLGMDVLVDGKSVAVLTFDAARAALSQGGGA